MLAVDYLGMDALPGVAILQKDFLDADAPDVILRALGGRKADLVLSDMAAPTTGHKATDHLRIMALCEAAADFARRQCLLRRRLPRQGFSRRHGERAAGAS